jgi:hypothetical protein
VAKPKRADLRRQQLRHVMCPAAQLPSADDLVLSREERERLAIVTIGWQGSTRVERTSLDSGDSHSFHPVNSSASASLAKRDRQKRRRRQLVLSHERNMKAKAGMFQALAVRWLSRATWYRMKKERERITLAVAA